MHVCDLCMRKGTYARCTAGCDFDICANCYVKKGGVLDKEVRARVPVARGGVSAAVGRPVSTVCRV